MVRDGRVAAVMNGNEKFSNLSARWVHNNNNNNNDDDNKARSDQFTFNHVIISIISFCLFLSLRCYNVYAMIQYILV